MYAASTSKLPIAVFTDKCAEYQQIFIRAIEQRLHQDGYPLLCVSGRELEPPHTAGKSSLAANRIYSLASDQQVAGIIFLSGALGHATTPSHLHRFVHSFNQPKVSLGLAADGVASVIVDDECGMRELMTHLLENGQSRSLAFIRGYPNDPYSAIRESVFATAAAEAGIAAEQLHYRYGNYDETTVFEAVNRLIRDHPEIDTIVAANDLMALSAVRAAVACGLKLPQDMVITGFDDTFDSIRTDLAITTVRQPLGEMGRLSAELLLQQVEGQAVAPLHTVKSQLVVRESSATRRTTSPPPGDTTTRELIASSLANKTNGLVTPDDACSSAIAMALQQTVEHNSNDFQSHCLPLLHEALSEVDQQWWLNLFYHIEHDVLPALDEVPLRSHINLLAQVGRVKSRLWGIASGQNADARRRQTNITQFQLSMSTAIDGDEVIDYIETLTSTLELNRCYTVVFAAPEYHMPEWSTLLCHHRDQQFERNRHERFPTLDILPASQHRELLRGRFVLTPISASGSLFGYLVTDADYSITSQLEAIAYTLGTTFAKIDLMERLASKTRELEQVNQNLLKLAATDSVTQLPNRHQFGRDLQELIAEIKTGRESSVSSDESALLFIDLDGFKEVNDTLGHEAGDELLRVLSDRMDRHIATRDRTQGKVYRLGGDEFTVLLPHIDNVSVLATELLKLIAEPVTIGRSAAHVSASIGISVYLHSANDTCSGADVRSDTQGNNRSGIETAKIPTTDSWLQEADHAMYAAKREGKNRFAFAGSRAGANSGDKHDTSPDRTTTVAGSDVEPQHRELLPPSDFAA